MATYWDILIDEGFNGSDVLFHGYVRVESNVVTHAFNYNFNRNDGEFPDSNQANINSWTDCLAATDYYSSNSLNTQSLSNDNGGGDYQGQPVNNQFVTSPGSTSEGANSPGPQIDFFTTNTTTGAANQYSGAFGLPINGFILNCTNTVASGKENAVITSVIGSVPSTTDYGDPNYFQIVPYFSNTQLPEFVTTSSNTTVFYPYNPYYNNFVSSSYYAADYPSTSRVLISALAGDPSCFLENTAILCFSKTLGQDRYLPIQTLRVGDLVKTFKHGYRKIQNIGKSYMFNDPHIWYSRLWVLKKTEENGLLEDVIMTGGHGIMVDNFTKDVLKSNAKQIVGHKYVEEHPIDTIDGKSLVLAAAHKDTVGLKDNNFYTTYHLTLENDGDENKRFCIWADGMLSETPSEHLYKCNGYIDLDEEHYYQIENGKPEEKEIADKKLAMMVFKFRINSVLKKHLTWEKKIEDEVKEKEHEFNRVKDELKTVKNNTKEYTEKVTPILENFKELEKALNSK